MCAGIKDLHLMIDAVAHRGPDAEGFFEDEIIALGHKRLSILDLSHNADQPMFSHDKRNVMVYNGEVYNYIELAGNENSHRGFQLNTTSDSEVMLESFAMHGIKSVEGFNGMFAFAIYDKLAQELFIVRDRIGIKPLYYYYADGEFAFASELKSFRNLKQIKFKLNNEAIYNYLHVGYIPAPQSIYQHIYKLEQGHWLKISKTGIEKECYWQPENCIEKAIHDNEASAKKKLDNLLHSSVSLQMRSDVPFGVLLSGGTDSSVVASIASENSKSKINTFSIGFKEKSYNEADHAKSIARHLKTNHHEFIVTLNDALELAEHVMLNYDEPFADSSAIPTYLVSQLARKHVKVVLSGDGGDELFLGYGTHTWAKRLDSRSLNLIRKPAEMALSKMNSRFKRVASLFRYNANTFMPAHIFSQEHYFFSSDEIKALLSDSALKNFSSGFFNSFFRSKSTARNLSKPELQALFDINYYLPDDLLLKVDRASMKHSLEVRVPLLDHRIVEFALNLSPGLKIKRGVAKYLLKQVLYDYIPKSLLDRPKQGFSIPLSKWLENELYFLIEKYLNKSAIQNQGILNYSEVKTLLTKWKSGSDYLYNRVWQLIILQKWLDKNFML